MIQSLRRAHWRVMLSLTVILPLIIAGGILARPTFLKMTPLPEEGRVLFQEGFIQWSTVGLRVRFEKPAKETERALMCVVPVESSPAPDVLAYWSPAAIQGSALNEGSVLLGSLKGRQSRCMNIPIGVPESTGSLVLFSLADHSVIAHAPWQITFAPRIN